MILARPFVAESGTLCLGTPCRRGGSGHGSFLAGLLLALTSTVWPAPFELRLFLGVVILSAFTTFPTLAMDTAYLAGRHRPLAVAIYVLASVALSLAGAFAGYHLAYAALA